VGPHHPPWITAPLAKQPLVNICRRVILADKRAVRLIKATVEGGLGLSGQRWVLWEAVSMGSRNPAPLVVVPPDYA